MKLKQYQVDAFATRAFEGNPAAVCPLETWLDKDVMQSIAAENNLSETAFFVRVKNGFDLRWFTPVAEVDLCGHATLGSAHVLFEHLGYAQETITFHTRSGELTVRKNGALLEMDFPASELKKCDPPRPLIQGLGITPSEVLVAEDYLAVLPHEEAVRNLKPDLSWFFELRLRGVIVTAAAENPGVDFVSRFFAPNFGIDEDPVTGSAHCQLAPYWGKRLGKTRLQARQISRRSGSMICELKGDRVLLLGGAVTFMEGEISFEV